MKKRILIIAIVTALLLSACTMGKKTGSGNANKDLKDDIASEEAVKLTKEEYKQLREKLCNGEEADLPKMFDLRDYNLVTPVKNQGQYGICWAYAAISAMESNALIMGFGEYDLSEYHIGYLAYNDPNGGFSSQGASDGWLGVGGFNEYSIAPFMRGYAPASENKYPSDDVQRKLSADAINDNVLNGDSSYFVQASKKDEIKRFIIEYGAVTACVDAGSWYMDESGNRTDIRMSPYFNFDTNAVYSSMTSVDHMVTVIGWDDNYSEDNFKIKPKNNGAWIIKNSWGERREYTKEDLIRYFKAMIFMDENAKSFLEEKKVTRVDDITEEMILEYSKAPSIDSLIELNANYLELEYDEQNQK